MPSEEKQRTIFGVLVLPAPEHPGSGQVVMTPSWTLPLSTTLHDIVASALGMYGFLRDRQGAAGPASPAPDRPVAPSSQPQDYAVFDPEGGELALQTTIGQIPKPGAVIVVSRSIESGGSGQSVAVVAIAAWRYVQDSGPFKRYFTTRHPDFEPVVGFEFDVFLSYSTDDESTARDLEDQFSRKGLRVFLASKSIQAGASWSNALRDALRAARLVVVLLTPSSIKSPWVLSEAGAFWALGKPVIPAFAYVKPGELPGPLAQFQGRPASSPSQITELAEEVARLCKQP